MLMWQSKPNLLSPLLYNNSLKLQIVAAGSKSNGVQNITNSPNVHPGFCSATTQLEMGVHINVNAKNILETLLSVMIDGYIWLKLELSQPSSLMIWSTSCKSIIVNLFSIFLTIRIDTLFIYLRLCLLQFLKKNYCNGLL